ncbi:aminoacyl-tRNA hydrolase [Dongshaea marina]|uniref:aminoacyl-tRNA hydrolase n=1 Tax=Dongshaea marina TaxID=2047966 RepID=UPI000D3E4825|nr:aminoacyl-tRNA hydrolase [Dongshaea marina]
MKNSIQLIVGLGNPGQEYAATRHNVGAWFVERLAARHQLSLKEDRKFFGYTGRVRIQDQEVHLLIPTTYMNLSGQALSALARFYKIGVENILVVHDELDLPPGVARFKKGGGAGGHNGLKDIIQKLGNNKEFYRLRIGIGHPGSKDRVHGFVLGKPCPKELALIDEAIDEALTCSELWLKQDLPRAMNRLHSFNANPS